jgi:ankyrin repeat protein
MHYRLLSLANGHDLDALKAWLAGEAKAPPAKDLIKAASFAKDPDIRDFLVDRIMVSKVSAKTGWNDAHLAAMSGKAEHFVLAEQRKADFEAPSSAGRPLMIAVRNGHVGMVKALLEKGVDATRVEGGSDALTALSFAIRIRQTEIAEVLIDRGAATQLAMLEAVRAGDVALIERFVNQGLQFDGDCVAALNTAKTVECAVALGVDLSKPPERSLPAWWSWANYRAESNEAKREFMIALREAGAPLRPQDLADIFSGFGKQEEFDPALLAALAPPTLDVNVPVSWEDEDGKTKKMSLVECALRVLPLSVVVALVERGASIPQGLRVEPSWLEAQQKRAWLASRGNRERQRSPREFLELDDFTAEELTCALVHDGILGLRVGMREADVAAAGFEPEHNGESVQALWVELDDGEVHELQYTHSDSSPEDEAAVAAALTSQLGPAVGVDVRRWNHPSGMLELRLRHEPMSHTYKLELHMRPGRVQPGQPAEDLTALGATLTATFRAISDDVLDRGAVERVCVEATPSGLRFDLTLEGTDAVAVLDWTDLPLDADGNITQDLELALIHAASEELENQAEM